MQSTIRQMFGIILTMALVLGAGATFGAEVLKIGAGAAATENILKKIEFPFTTASGIKLDITDSGPIQAFKDLNAGSIHCAIGGVAFQDWMEMMEKSGHPIPDKSVYKNWVIGEDKIKILVNSDIKVTSLSKEQLAAIFTGKTTNWSQVGGPDKPIIVVLGSEIPGTQAVFRQQIMGNAEYTKNPQMGTTAEDVKSRVVRNSGAIGLGTVSQVDYLINSPATPAISRPVTLITKGAPSEAVKKLIDFVNGEGQRFIPK